MLAFAAITPHPPLLIPNIGKKKLEKLNKTKTALEEMEQDLYLSKPDVIMIISPHGSIFEDAFSVNAETKFQSCYDEFGDMSTKDEWKGISDLAAKIGHEGNVRGLPIQLVSEQKLDHGTCIPLHYLTKHLENVKILPVGFSKLDNKKHLEFGELLKDIIMDSSKHIALIASGDLSHTLTKDAPAGFYQDAHTCDEQIISMLENKNTVGFSNIDKKLIEKSVASGYYSILLALGILKNMDYTFKNLSYEAPFGVGYLVGQFVF